ncbi:MAG: HAD family phosphatase [Ruminococcaceae bacterium]|nr:HAD family phosphatase [Oscillospiraceae bacterium]
MFPLKNINEITTEEALKIKFILTDIDGTLTNSEGRIAPETYTMLWKLKKAGYTVIPVTGRTAGWAAVAITDWPVDAIIVESGSVVYYLENGSRKEFVHPSVPKDRYAVHEKIKETALAKNPKIKVSIDQYSRFNDFAFNYAEDEDDKLTFDEAKEVLEAVKAIGAKGNISSIHVNTWFGDYDKLPSSLLYLKEHYGIDDPKECVIYFGDAANDEEMFGYFPTACGVANLMKYVEHMEHLPAYITTYEGGEGFCEAAEILLTAKKNSIAEKYGLKK